MKDVVTQPDQADTVNAGETLSTIVSKSMPEPHWPLYYAWVTSWIYPATTARRTAQTPMWKVWLFHVCTLLMLVVTICVTVAANTAQPKNFSRFCYEYRAVFDDLLHEIQRYPYQTSSILLFSFAGIEIFFFLSAFLTMAWGARDESIKASFHNALRRIWICTANILPPLIVVSAIGVTLEHQNIGLYQYYQSIQWPNAPKPLGIPKSDPKFTKANATYQAAMDKYQQEFNVITTKASSLRSIQPWYVQHREFIIVVLSIMAGMWFIWGLLRSIGARRDMPLVDRPPLCEYCGYNLTTMPMESRCPECGEPVINSLGSEVRRGTAWDKHGQSTRWAAWKECFVEPIVRPKEFGRTLQVTQPVSAHRTYLFCNLPVVFAIGAISMLVAVVIVTGMNPFRNDLLEFCFAIVIFGCACVIGTVVVTLFGGWLIGWGHSIKYKRNLMPVSIQASCYLSGYLILWAILGALNFLFLHWGYEYRIFHSIRDVTGMYVDTIATLFWFVPNVTCGIYYLLLIARTTSGAWYANR